MKCPYCETPREHASGWFGLSDIAADIAQGFLFSQYAPWYSETSKRKASNSRIASDSGGCCSSCAGNDYYPRAMYEPWEDDE